MDSLIKQSLCCSQLESYGHGGGGCISSGQGYTTETHGHIFVKQNSKKGARLMFNGEYACLDALHKTSTVKVPQPHTVFDTDKDGAALVMEYIEIGSLRKHAAELGEQLAKLHLHNHQIQEKATKKQQSIHKQGGEDYRAVVSQFGFHTPTCCGFIPQDNTWQDDWLVFYARNKLGQQLNLIEKEYGDREAKELWGKLERKLPELFKDVEVFPSLLHGDLWGGNAGETDNAPVIFDPASFYGHSEFDLGISCMFGGFSASFWKSYHQLIPKAPGFDKRNQLYQLFHYLNHWNHFGSGYRGTSLSIMKQLSK